MNESIRDAVLRGLQFIEANLRQEIGVKDVANAAAYSQFYFSREFSRLAHISVYDYILRRKLSESYRELFEKRCKIVDLAYRYGFQSHEVYTRAFRKMFGENPSEATVYQPLAVYDAIDEPYLAFLSGLRIERIEKHAEKCRFAVTGAASDFSTGEDEDLLVLFAPDNRFRCSCVLRGHFHENQNEFLCFTFDGLRHTLRLHHTDLPYIFRHYINNIYEGYPGHYNYLILRTAQSHTDILLPDHRPDVSAVVKND